jgi:transcription initiation factor TFIID TATA-box-binding protein
MPEIVNVVASGDLGRELDVAAVVDDINAGVVNTQGGEYRTPTLYVKQSEGSPLVTVYESGSCHISGAGSVTETESARDWFMSALGTLGIGVGDVTFGAERGCRG